MKGKPRIPYTNMKNVGGQGSQNWTAAEDQALRAAVEAHGDNDWLAIARLVHKRTAQQCQSRWTRALRFAEIKPWTPEDDALLTQIVNSLSFASVQWSDVAKQFPGRIGKQCRERWLYHLDPNISRESFNAEEDRVIFESQLKVGNKWSCIARYLPGRTENSVKNRWNSIARRKWFVEHGLPLEDRDVAALFKHAKIDAPFHDQDAIRRAAELANPSVPFMGGRPYIVGHGWADSGGTSKLSSSYDNEDSVDYSHIDTSLQNSSKHYGSSSLDALYASVSNDLTHESSSPCNPKHDSLRENAASNNLKFDGSQSISKLSLSVPEVFSPHVLDVSSSIKSGRKKLSSSASQSQRYSSVAPSSVSSLSSDDALFASLVPELSLPRFKTMIPEMDSETLNFYTALLAVDAALPQCSSALSTLSRRNYQFCFPISSCWDAVQTYLHATTSIRNRLSLAPDHPCILLSSSTSEVPPTMNDAVETLRRSQGLPRILESPVAQFSSASSKMQSQLSQLGSCGGLLDSTVFSSLTPRVLPLIIACGASSGVVSLCSRVVANQAWTVLFQTVNDTYFVRRSKVGSSNSNSTVTFDPLQVSVGGKQSYPSNYPFFPPTDISVLPEKSQKRFSSLEPTSLGHLSLDVSSNTLHVESGSRTDSGTLTPRTPVEGSPNVGSASSLQPLLLRVLSVVEAACLFAEAHGLAALPLRLQSSNRIARAQRMRENPFRAPQKRAFAYPAAPPSGPSRPEPSFGGADLHLDRDLESVTVQESDLSDELLIPQLLCLQDVQAVLDAVAVSLCSLWELGPSEGGFEPLLPLSLLSSSKLKKAVGVRSTEVATSASSTSSDLTSLLSALPFLHVLRVCSDVLCGLIEAGLQLEAYFTVPQEGATVDFTAGTTVSAATVANSSTGANTGATTSTGAGGGVGSASKEVFSRSSSLGRARTGIPTQLGQLAPEFAGGFAAAVGGAGNLCPATSASASLMGDQSFAPKDWALALLSVGPHTTFNVVQALLQAKEGVTAPAIPSSASVSSINPGASNNNNNNTNNNTNAEVPSVVVRFNAATCASSFKWDAFLDTLSARRAAADLWLQQAEAALHDALSSSVGTGLKSHAHDVILKYFAGASSPLISRCVAALRSREELQQLLLSVPQAHGPASVLPATASVSDSISTLASSPPSSVSSHPEKTVAGTHDSGKDNAKEKQNVGERRPERIRRASRKLSAADADEAPAAPQSSTNSSGSSRAEGTKRARRVPQGADDTSAASSSTAGAGANRGASSGVPSSLLVPLLTAVLTAPGGFLHSRVSPLLLGLALPALNHSCPAAHTSSPLSGSIVDVPLPRPQPFVQSLLLSAVAARPRPSRPPALASTLRALKLSYLAAPPPATTPLLLGDSMLKNDVTETALINAPVVVPARTEPEVVGATPVPSFVHTPSLTHTLEEDFLFPVGTPQGAPSPRRRAAALTTGISIPGLPSRWKCALSQSLLQALRDATNEMDVFLASRDLRSPVSASFVDLSDAESASDALLTLERELSRLNVDLRALPHFAFALARAQAAAPAGELRPVRVTLQRLLRAVLLQGTFLLPLHDPLTPPAQRPDSLQGSDPLRDAKRARLSKAPSDSSQAKHVNTPHFSDLGNYFPFPSPAPFFCSSNAAPGTGAGGASHGVGSGNSSMQSLSSLNTPSEVSFQFPASDFTAAGAVPGASRGDGPQLPFYNQPRPPAPLNPLSPRRNTPAAEGNLPGLHSPAMSHSHVHSAAGNDFVVPGIHTPGSSHSFSSLQHTPDTLGLGMGMGINFAPFSAAQLELLGIPASYGPRKAIAQDLLASRFAGSPETASSGIGISVGAGIGGSSLSGSAVESINGTNGTFSVPQEEACRPLALQLMPLSYPHSQQASLPNSFCEAEDFFSVAPVQADPQKRLAGPRTASTMPGSIVSTPSRSALPHSPLGVDRNVSDPAATATTVPATRTAPLGSIGSTGSPSFFPLDRDRRLSLRDAPPPLDISAQLQLNLAIQTASHGSSTQQPRAVGTFRLSSEPTSPVLPNIKSDDTSTAPQAPPLSASPSSLPGPYLGTHLGPTSFPSAGSGETPASLGSTSTGSANPLLLTPYSPSTHSFSAPALRPNEETNEEAVRLAFPRANGVAAPSHNSQTVVTHSTLEVASSLPGNQKEPGGRLPELIFAKNTAPSQSPTRTRNDFKPPLASPTREDDCGFVVPLLSLEEGESNFS